MNNKIYIGNLTYNISKQAIEEAFGKFGTVTDVALITDSKTGRPKGFGFITFESSEAANEAIKELDGTDLGGRSIKVSIAREKESGGSRGGGGG